MNAHLPHRPAETNRNVNLHETERVLSVAAGAAFCVWALDRRPLSALAGFALGGGLLYRGLTGHCGMYRAMGVSSNENQAGRLPHGVPAQQGERVEVELMIDAPPKQVYESWRHLRNVPSILKHVTSVTELDENRSRWTLKTPIGVELKWDAEIINDEPNRLIAWESIPGGSMNTAGAVHFDAVAEGKRTRLTLNMKYDPPGGKVGIWVAQALGADLHSQLAQDLRDFKQRMEQAKATAKSP
jgi:uncharacterized membrane protein